MSGDHRARAESKDPGPVGSDPPAARDSSHRGRAARVGEGAHSIGGVRNPAGLTAGVWIVAAIVSLFLLRAASQLFIPIVIAVLVSYALEPAVARMHAWHIPRPAGAGFLLTLMLLLLSWGAFGLRAEVWQAAEALSEVAAKAREVLWPSGGPVGGRQAGAVAPLVPGGGSPLTDWLQLGVMPLLAVAGHVTVIIFLVFFLLISGRHFRARVIEIAGPHLERRRITAAIIDDIDAQIQRFLLVRVFAAALVAGATWAVLAWMGAEQAALWGLLAGVFNSIPYFGPLVVSGGLIVVGLAQSADPIFAIKISAAALVITSLEGWLLTPPLLGKAERMHAVVVFLGVLLWTWIWGAWGTLLAVPMLVIVKAVADHVEELKPVSRLISR